MLARDSRPARARRLEGGGGRAGHLVLVFRRQWPVQAAGSSRRYRRARPCRQQPVRY